MPANLINTDDFRALFRRIARWGFLSEFSRFLKSNRKRTERIWTSSPSPPTNWCDIPAIWVRWNYLITGNPGVDYFKYISETYFKDRKDLTALSLGCGTGDREMRWAEGGRFKRMDGYDLSESMIRQARENAGQRDYGDLFHFQPGDINKISLNKNYYDVVFAEHALHHFSPLEKILTSINECLKSDGLFIVNEFIGPSRFQWTDRQLEAANALLKIIPESYRQIYGTNTIKRKVHKPGRLYMMMMEPSEAVESSNIRPLLKKMFKVVEQKDYGGSILHVLLTDIAHHFRSEDDLTQRLLYLCYDVEDMLLKCGELDSDFALIICKKRET